MRRWVALLVSLAVGVTAIPALGAVDLLQRLEEKGILTAEERKELEAEQASVKPSAKGFGLSWASPDGRFSSTLYGYGQLRYTFEDPDQGENTSNFSVQRVRLGLRGHTFVKDLRYVMSLDVYSGNERQTVLEYFYVDYAPLDEVGLMAGQYKVPYGLQWNISAASQQFVDRTAVDGNFRFDYDTGLTLHGKFLQNKLSYDAGVFNGEGKNKNNSDDKHLYVARIALQPLSPYSMSEADPGRSESLAVLLGGAVAYNNSVASHTRNNLNGRLTALGASDVTSYNVFAGAKLLGASLQSEYHRRNIDPDSSAKEETAVGFYAQAGMMVWKKSLELAARYEYFDPNDDVTDDLRQQYGLGVNWYLDGHRHKIQADGFRDHNQRGGSATDTVARVQYQLRY